MSNPQQEDDFDCTNDIDGDGVFDEVDLCPRVPNQDQEAVEPGLGAACAMQVDADGDLVLDPEDNCLGVANADQADIDQNGIGEACQSFFDDTDGDGIPDYEDLCGLWPSPPANPECSALDQADPDGDGIANVEDICPLVSNPAQREDDPCMTDFDGDGVEDIDDVCPFLADPEQQEAEPGRGVACTIPIEG